MKTIVQLLSFLFICISCEKEIVEKEPKNDTLHVSVVPHGSGVVTPMGGYFEDGTEIEFTINPKEGYIFKEYNGDVNGTSLPLTVTINAQKTFTVVFEGIDADGDGVIDIEDFCPNTPKDEIVNDIGCSASQKYYVPDDNFERKLIELGYDDVMDGYVPENQIEKIETLDIGKSNISDVTGIENFFNLRILQCNNNLISSIDLSNFPLLTKFSCSGNQLMNIDLSNNPLLTRLNCESNPLTSLDLSQNPNIDTLLCRHGRISNLDLTHNKKLIYVECSDNRIKNLDVSNVSTLTELWCSRNGMRNINVTNCTGLLKLFMNANKLQNINISTNTSLEILNLPINELSSIDVSKNISLISLGLSFNQLSSLDVSQNLSLLKLSCDYNPLTCIKVSQSQLNNIPAEWYKPEAAVWSPNCN